MPFTLKYSDIANPNFQNTVRKIQHAQLPVRTAYSLKRIVDAIERELKIMSEAFTKDVLQVYAEKNEKGEFVTDEADPTQIKIPEANRDEFIKAQIGFGSREFTIQRAKLNYLELGTQLQLSVPELAILSPMLLDETGENDNVVALPTASQPAPGA